MLYISAAGKNEQQTLLSICQLNNLHLSPNLHIAGSLFARGGLYHLLDQLLAHKNATTPTSCSDVTKPS
jgi:hypothetical protein